MLQIISDGDDMEEILQIISLTDSFRAPPQFKSTNGMMLDILMRGNDSQYVTWFRMKRTTFIQLHNIIFGLCEEKSSGRPKLDTSVKLGIFLIKCATNMSLNSISDFAGAGLGSTQRACTEICEAVVALFPHFIKWPEDTSESAAAFLKRCGIPNVIGAIDGTHVEIEKPAQFSDNYINRKNYFSLNILAVCDAKGVFM